MTDYKRKHRNNFGCALSNLLTYQIKIPVKLVELVGTYVCNIQPYSWHTHHIYVIPL